MNSIDSMTEPVQTVSTFADGDHNCTAIDNTTGKRCGEIESLKILDEFQKLYENRIQNVDQEIDNEFDRVFMKLEISREWIKNLREQNVMLVQIVEDLEQAACSRVKLLEQKLKQTSTIVSENLTKSGYTEQTINTLTNRVNNLQKEEEHMHQRIKILQNDIKGLLELIRRASQENRWNLEGLKFIEIQPDDIPAPLDCSCGQEETNQKRIQSLKLQIEQLQGNEKRMIECQRELEQKLVDLTEKLETKEDTIQKYLTQNQNLTDSLKKRTQFGNETTCNSFLTNDQETSDIVLVADIVEKMFIEKDLEMRNLQQRLHIAESALGVVTCDTDTNINNLKIKLNEKCRLIEEIKQQMSNTQKELLEKQDTLTAEVIEKNKIVTSLQKKIVTLQEQCYNANVQIQFKEDVIKEMRKKLKRTMDKAPRVSPNAYVDTVNCQENHVISYLTKVKSLMEQDEQNIFKLKIELEKAMEKLCCAKNNEDTNIQYELSQNIDYIQKICPEKKELIAIINSIILKLGNNNSLYIDGENLPVCVDSNQQFKLMDVMRASAIETKMTADNIQDEMTIIASIFKSKHQKYVNLDEEVINLQNQLIRNREKIIEILNTLDLQKEEKTRHNERIISGKVKLKNIKDEMNRAQVQLSIHLKEMEDNMKKGVRSSYSEVSLCNDLVCSVIKEIEQTSDSLQVLQTQEYCTTSNIEIVTHQLREIESNIIGLQKKINEALSEHDVTETFFNSKEQKTLQTECDDECQWKCRVTDLQGQVQILQNEVKCKQEANEVLKSSITSMEEELCSARTRAEKYKLSHSVDSIELKKKIIQLENTLKLQEEKECTLRQQLNESEAELDKSKEFLNTLNNERSIEDTLLRCSCNRFKHDSMTASQLFKTLENTIASTKRDIENLKTEYKELIYEDESKFRSSARLLMNLIDKFQKCEDELDNCSQEIEKLKNALHSKNKLIEDRDEMIKIQKEAILMTQSEVKELHQKLQDKIDNQDQILAQCEKEKKQLLMQNELQSQTIGHLQNAVVEAKRCIDQMGHRTMSDVSDQWSTISSSMYGHGNVHDV